MQEYNIAFAKLSYFVPFLHITATIFLVGIQAGFWLVFRRFLKEDMRPRVYMDMLNTLKDFGYSIIVCLVVITITGFFMDSNKSNSITDPMANAILTTKYTLAGFLALNLGYMAYCYVKSLKAYKKNEMIECHENIYVIVRYFMPLNFVVALVATYLGIAYRECSGANFSF